MRLTLEKIISIPKSFYVSWRLMGFRKACRLPVLVRFNTRLLELDGCVKVTSTGGERKGAMLKIGFGRVGIFDRRYERSVLQISGTIDLKGMASFGTCCRLSIAPGATLIIGDNFNNSANLTLFCTNKITIGDNFLASWGTFIMDTDSHEIEHIESGYTGQASKPIIIGNNVWLCMNSCILKGSCIPDNCIIGSHSLVNKCFSGSSCLIAGNPAIVRKTGIRRKL